MLHTIGESLPSMDQMVPDIKFQIPRKYVQSNAASMIEDE